MSRGCGELTASTSALGAGTRPSYSAGTLLELSKQTAKVGACFSARRTGYLGGWRCLADLATQTALESSPVGQGVSTRSRKRSSVTLDSTGQESNLYPILRQYLGAALKRACLIRFSEWRRLGSDFQGQSFKNSIKAGHNILEFRNICP